MYHQFYKTQPHHFELTENTIWEDSVTLAPLPQKRVKIVQIEVNEMYKNVFHKMYLYPLY